MKIFTKYNRINLSVMTFVFVLSGIAYYFLISNIFIHELDESLHDYEERLHTYIEKEQKIPRFEFFEDIEINYYPASSKSKKQYKSVTKFNEEDHKESIYRELTFTEKIGHSYYKFSIAKPIEGTKFVTKTIATATLLILLIIIASSVILNRIILKKLWQPFYKTIQELSNFKLSRGYIPSFSPTDVDEFDFLNQSLTEVINAADHDYRILKEFTENAAHELQTPLAIIRSKLDLVVQEEGLSQNQSTALHSAYTGINRLTKLNHSLLLLSKIENKQFSGKEDIELQEELREKIGLFEDLWAAKDINVTSELKTALLHANTELIEILFNNLLANTARHTPMNGSVDINLYPGNLIIKNTADSGALDHSRLFKRFYKEAAHSHSNGLGLSIIKQICEDQGIGIVYEFQAGYHSFHLRWRV